MYAGKAELVKVPKEKVHILKNGYVYWYDTSKWDNTLKRTVDNRKSIGKLDPDHPGMMFPNQTYFTLFAGSAQAASDAGVLKEDGSTKLPVPGKFATVLNFGPFLALLCAAKNIGTLEILKKFFPRLYREILALAIHSIDEQSSVGQDFPYWAFHNYCGLSKPLSSGEISRVYEEIAEDPEDVRNFMYYHKELYHSVIHDASETVLAFDSTNQSTSSSGIPLAEYGHPKDKRKKKLPDINTALFVDESTGIPLYYEHFCGSILDKSQTPFTVERAKDLGFKKLFLMMDRGYFSQQVIDSLSDMKFGLMCPDSLTLVKDVITAYADSVKDNEDHYILEENVYGIHLADQNVCNGSYDVYLFYDPMRAEDERDAIHGKIKRLLGIVQERKRYRERLVELYSPWLIIKKIRRSKGAVRNFTVEENKPAIQECLNEAGFFVILSNAHLDAGNMIRVARMRDRGEKAFRRIKTQFGLSETYMHEATTYEGKMFVAFIALIIVETYRWYIRNELSAISSTTTATTLGELRKFQIQLKPDRTWMPVYAPTKKQKKIFAALNISNQEIEDMVRAVKLRV